MKETQEHYNKSTDATAIIERLRTAYPDGPTLFHLAPIDQLHTGGIKASQKIAKQIATYQPERVLDIGSGLGGLARVCLEEIAADYICLDFTHAFSVKNQRINQLLARPTSPLVITSDGQQLPFADCIFDVVLLQHSLLNMPSKESALAECLRVLKPGGHLVLHELVQDNSNDKLDFPTPWASSAESSHIEPESTLKETIARTGFQHIESVDCTAEALEWRARQLSKAQNNTAPVLTPADILGPEFSVMAHNLHQNLINQKVRIIELVASKPE